MNESDSYSRDVRILDNFLKSGIEFEGSISEQTTWKHILILKLFKQQNNALRLILFNSSESKFKLENSIDDLVLVGSLGRLIRDIYVNIIYLKTNEFTDDQMKACWDHQIIKHQLYSLINEANPKHDHLRIKLQLEVEALKKQLDLIQFHTKGQVYEGKSEKLISLQKLANLKGFDKVKFEKEFSYFSQFSHSTAFATEFSNNAAYAQTMRAITYHKIVAYVVGTNTECLESFDPNHHQTNELQTHYSKIIKTKWT